MWSALWCIAYPTTLPSSQCFSAIGNQLFVYSFTRGLSWMIWDSLIFLVEQGHLRVAQNYLPPPLGWFNAKHCKFSRYSNTSFDGQIPIWESEIMWNQHFWIVKPLFFLATGGKSCWVQVRKASDTIEKGAGKGKRATGHQFIPQGGGSAERTSGVLLMVLVPSHGDL